MRTRRANWDYASRDNRPALYNARCPICGHECYDGKGPGFIFYACPKCGMVEEDKQNPGQFTKTVKRMVAVGRVAPGIDVMVVDPEFIHESIVTPKVESVSTSKGEI